MTRPRARFRLLPIDSLRTHEEVEEPRVVELVEEIRRTGVVVEPIWVAEGSNVILNGHHRFWALQRLGAIRVPAWLIDYDDPAVEVERWAPGPPVSKSQVVERAHTRLPFPPKTTRHSVAGGFPHRPTPLPELQRPAARRARQAPTGQGAAPRFSRGRTGSSGSG